MSRFLRWSPVLLALVAPGCSEELGPERFETTRVRGKVTVGARAVGGGWVAFEPAGGTVGNLRIAPIRPDGTFDVDRVPVGTVVVGLDQIPLAAIPTPGGNVPAYEFRAGRSPIRRTIPADPSGFVLEVDLLDEAIRMPGRPRGNRRRRSRRAGKSRDVGDVGSDRGDRRARSTAPGPTPGIESVPRVRVIYRDSAGAIHLDWPADRVAEAIADAEGTVWVDIEDLESANNSHVEAMLRDVFHFHGLAIEDALQDTHVPKVDDWGDYLYIVVDTLDFHPETDEIRLHELDLFLGPNFLLSYHNEALEVLERHRGHLVREPNGRLKAGPAHLLYRLLDDVVAEFLPAIQHLDDAIDDAQDEVFHVPTPTTLRKIFQVKTNALRMHRVAIPMREVLNRLARDPYAQIPDESRVYFRDVYDHLVRVHDIVESLRDLISGALDTYLSVVSNRTNDIMKALTLVNVMFLPMSFVAGFFGMNFFGETLMFRWPDLPRAGLFWLACGVMIGTPVFMAIVARRRGWI